MKKKHQGKLRLQAAIGLIERRGRYLICQRLAGDSFGDCWEFPGGKRESGESWEVCLRRELREELGIAVRILKVCGSMRHEFADGVVSFRVFRCVIARGRPRPLSARTLRWVKPDQLARYRFPPANRPLITRLSGAASSVCR